MVDPNLRHSATPVDVVVRLSNAAGREDTGRVDVDGWNERYRGSACVWSGHPNEAVTEYAPAPTAGPKGLPRALDLGCGEGGDAIWLASQGWQVVGVDWAAVALDRARAAAADAGVEVSFVEADVTDRSRVTALAADGPFDLVTVAFLHPEVCDQTKVYSPLPPLVAPGGHLLVVAHAAAPPWADASAHEHRFLSAAEELSMLELDPELWETVFAETRTRTSVGPDGILATLDDSVVLARRR